MKIVVKRPKRRGVMPPPSKKYGTPKGKRGYDRNRSKRTLRDEAD